MDLPLEEKTKNKMYSVIKNIENGHTIAHSCELAGVNRGNYYCFLKRDKELKELHDHVLESRTQIVEDALFQSAIKGNTAAQIFWLKNRASHRWKEKVEVKSNADIDSSKTIESIKKEVSVLIKDLNIVPISSN